MRKYKKAIGIAVLTTSVLQATLGMSVAAEMSFPNFNGNVEVPILLMDPTVIATVDSNNNIIVHVNIVRMDGYDDYIAVYNSSGKQVQRTRANLKSNKNILGVFPPDKYTIFIKRFDPKTNEWLTLDQTSITITKQKNLFDRFPGKVVVNSNGTITITLQWSQSYSMYNLYLVILENGQIKKRIPIDPYHPNVDPDNWNLTDGDYTIVLEIEDPSTDKTYHSEPVKWKKRTYQDQTWSSTGTFPKGTIFPGEVSLGDDGTIIITVNLNPTQYKIYVIVFDAHGREVKRTPFDPRKQKVSLGDFGLVDGSYTVVIEILDPSTGKTTRSNGNTINWPQRQQPSNDGISVTVDGQLLMFDQIPVMENGRTLVPLRKIFESLGATVLWDGNTQTVTATKQNKIVILHIGHPNAMINGEDYTLDQPGILLNGRTMVPVRFVSEALGALVNWDGNTQTVKIITNQR